MNLLGCNQHAVDVPKKGSNLTETNGLHYLGTTRSTQYACSIGTMTASHRALCIDSLEEPVGQCRSRCVLDTDVLLRRILVQIASEQAAKTSPPPKRTQTPGQ